MRQQPKLDELVETLYGRMLDREAREVARLNQVLQLAGHDGCQVSRLGEHFGEPLAQPCGHCSWCLNGHSAAKLPHRVAPPIDELMWHQAIALRAQQPDPLADPRSFARFLCGLTSPKLSRGRFTSLSLFGSLSAVPFAEVLQRTQR
jgi:ATP-dependent DNA helicase RecQ